MEYKHLFKVDRKKQKTRINPNKAIITLVIKTLSCIKKYWGGMKAVTTTQNQIKLFSNVSKKIQKESTDCSWRSVHPDNKIKNQKAREPTADQHPL